MNTLRNKNTEEQKFEPSPNAFDYDDDVTEKAVKHIQEKADRVMEHGKWSVVEGYKFG